MARPLILRPLRALHAPLSVQPFAAMSTLIRRRTSELDTLRREMDRLFTNFLPAPSEENGTQAWAPRTDIVETDDAYHLAMDLPGVQPENVEVHYDDGMLRVSGQRETQSEHQDGRFHRIERSYGQFFRAFRLGSDVDPDTIDAAYDTGVLTVTVHKTEARKPRQISIRTDASNRPAQIQSETEELAEVA